MHYTVFLSLLWLCFSILQLQAQPQRRANIWHFGNREGLDFSCGAPVKVGGTKILSKEGATGICDENGNLLFYTNCGGGQPGISILIQGGIWNRNRELMYDLGQTVGGGISSAQGGIIVPAPASNSRYYLFTVDELMSIGSTNRPHRGLSYFLIDMAQNNGLGAVIQNITGTFSPAVECITAARHSNGTDFWILTVDYQSRDLVAVQVTANGVLPAVRHNRHILTHPLVLKLSPDGRFLFDGAGLYRFDASNGSIEWITAVPETHEYTFNFSPASNYLYIARRTPAAIIRYDLQVANIGAEYELVQLLGDYSARHMQTGPDGNIYFNTSNFARDFNRVDVSVIKCPDSDDPQVQFDVQTLSTDPAAGQFTSLHNIADFWFDKLLHELEIDTTEATVCEGADLTLMPACKGDAYLWSTAETAPQITVTEPGEYRVSVTRGCFTGMETFVVSRGSLPTVEIAHAPFDDFCSALPLTLTAVATYADSLVWSSGTSGNPITIDRGGRYAVTAINSCGQALASVDFPTEACCRIYVPNAFSPNGDGINDDFRVADFKCPFTDFKLQLFSRWGELVFETGNPGEAWNGRSGARERPSGLYVWLLSYRLTSDPQQQLRVETGELTLVR